MVLVDIIAQIDEAEVLPTAKQMGYKEKVEQLASDGITQELADNPQPAIDFLVDKVVDYIAAQLADVMRIRDLKAAGGKNYRDEAKKKIKKKA
jgi:hypothetical protein